LNKTLLHFAAQNGQTDVVASLMEKKSDINSCDADNNTPLLLALKADKTETVIFLIDIKDKNNERVVDLNVADKDGNTPLHVALIKKQAVNLVNHLINTKSDINVQNKVYHLFWQNVYVLLLLTNQ